MVERLACALKSAWYEKNDLQAVVSAIENMAPTSRERQDVDTSEFCFCESCDYVVCDDHNLWE